MYFDENDSIETLKNHLGKYTPDSIRQEAGQKLKQRLKNKGLSNLDISTLILRWED